MVSLKELLERGVEEIIEKKHLLESLRSGKKLRIKLGCDPSRPDLHLGHYVVLRKLKEFQELGHKVVFIIGDFTAKIGDPSGQSKTRPQLSSEEIKKNAQTYLEQVGKILPTEKTEILTNSSWYKKGGWAEVLQLSSKFTVAQILERDDFEGRFKKRKDIGIHELLYPIMQAYDSVMVHSDVEIGGRDQKFNMLAGRVLQRKMGLPPQDIITCPLLIGLDGKEKMSKSLNNYIAISDIPSEIYGKTMSIPDNLIIDYFRLATDLPQKEIDKISRKLGEGTNPRDLKAQLAQRLVEMYHGKEKAQLASEEFEKVFKKKELPTKIKEIKLKGGNWPLIDLLVATNLTSSRSEARRLISQGGVKVDGAVITSSEEVVGLYSGMIIQVGRRKFVKLRIETKKR